MFKIGDTIKYYTYTFSVKDRIGKGFIYNIGLNNIYVRNHKLHLKSNNHYHGTVLTAKDYSVNETIYFKDEFSHLKILLIERNILQ